MEIFNEYFGNLVFTQVDHKQNYVIYGAGVAAMFGGGSKRYVLLFVPSIYAHKKSARISELHWDNLQTRTFVGSYRLKNQEWVMPRHKDDVLLKVVDRTEKYSMYKAPNFPFEILLLHDPKKKTKYQYHNTLNLSAAVETFKAIINYKEDPQPVSYTPPYTPLAHPMYTQQPNFSETPLPSYPPNQDYEFM